jgi:hypothetical protein
MRPLPNSYAQTIQLTCLNCMKKFEAEIWLIVDTNEHPDLLERIHLGNLHKVICLKCGHISQVDAPLLIFRPEAKPAILFSPSQQTGREQNQQQVGGLLDHLRSSFPLISQDALSADDLPIVQRSLLPTALSDNPESASPVA